MPQDGYFDSGGVRLHYLDWGGDGPPLVLMHATMFFGGIWGPVVQALAGRFRVITPDQRGHGDSARPEDGYTFETFARDLRALLETLGLPPKADSPQAKGQVLAAGHSSGGTTIALHAALYPGVIRRMALIEPILLAREFVRRGPNPMADQARKRRPTWPSRQEMFDSYRLRPPFNTWREDVLRLYVEGGTFSRDGDAADLKCRPEYEARFYEAVGALDPWPYLERIACPTLIAWAQSGRPPPVFDREAVGRAIAGSHALVMPGVSHFAPMEKPEEVASLLTQFLAD